MLYNIKNLVQFDKRALMKTYPLNEARAEFSKLVERALAGEPQRVTRYGKEAVVIVSEDEWRARCRSAPTLGALLAQHARAGHMNESTTNRPWKERRLGLDFV
jgi:antitoxin Phd